MSTSSSSHEPSQQAFLQERLELVESRLTRALRSLQALERQLTRLRGYAPQREQDELREARAVLAESEGERAATAKPRACEACSELASRLAVSEAALESLRAAIRALTGEL